MSNGQLATVHAIGQNRLRMQRIEHVDAVGGVIERVEIHEAGARKYTYRLEYPAQRHPRPLSDGGPAFLTRVLGDLRAGGEPLQVRQGVVARPSHATFDRQAPVGKLAGPQAFVDRSALRIECRLSRVSRIGGTNGGNRGNIAMIVFLRQRPRGQQQSMGFVGQDITHPQDVAVRRRQRLRASGQ